MKKPNAESENRNTHTPPPEPQMVGITLNETEVKALLRSDVLAVFRELVASIDTKHGWHIRAVLEGALAAMQPPAPQPNVAGTADDIRAQGWVVAVHNDYRLNGEAHTFWLFTKGERAIKGEGRTDAAALDIVRAALATTEGKSPRIKCAICEAPHDNDVLTDICTSCETRINEEGSP